MYDYNKTLLDQLFKNDAPQAASEVEADEIIAIVDRSASMDSIVSAAEGGLNSFIREQREVGTANLTLVEFDDKIDLVYERSNIKNAPEYKLVPRGWTALYDAVGMTLANAESITTTGKKIVVIVTDGEENRSSEFTRERVFNRIEALKAKGWNFLFLAAGQDAMAVGQSIGIRGGSTLQYSADSFGTQGAYKAAAMYTSNLRSGMSLEAVEAQLTETIASTVGLSRSDINAIQAKPGEVLSGQGVAGPFISGKADPFAHVAQWPAINAEDTDDNK